MSESTDLLEIDALLATVKSERVKRCLLKEKALIENEAKRAATQSEPKRAVAKAESQSDIPRAEVVNPIARFEELPSVAWDQNAEYVNVYVSLPENVDSSQLKSDGFKCEFQPNSVDLQFTINSKTYRMFRDNLENEINDKDSSFKISKTRITLKLRKKGKYETWSNLTGKRAKLADPKERDPMASLNDMLKDMYNNGDDQMKKLIGESMLKSRQGGGAPL